MRYREKRIRAGIIYFNFSGYCKIKRNKTRKYDIPKRLHIAYFFPLFLSLSELINLANSK